MRAHRILIGTALLLLSNSGVAEDDDSELSTISVAEERLPDSVAGAAGVTISAQNAPKYKSFIVPELYPSLKSGNLGFHAAGKLRFVPQPHPLREATTSLPDTGKFLSVISQALSPGKIFDLDFTLFSLKENRLLHEFRGNLLRLYPAALNSSDKTGQVFREKLKLSWPQAIFGLSWLSFRFLGSDEDVVWVYSPAIKKARQLTGSNRSDGIATTGFSADDLFTWSGKPELVQGGEIQKVTYLVPFPEDALTTGVTSPGCVEVKREAPGEEGRGASSQWNFSSRRFPESAAWLPTEAVFVPRDLYRVELESRDPYSRYGRQILYVDAVTFLPIYKFVFNRAGQPWKTVMSGYGFELSQDKTQQTPFCAFTAVDDALTGQSYIIDFVRSAICSETNDRIKSVLFDPRKLGEETTATPSATPIESSTPEEWLAPAQTPGVSETQGVEEQNIND